MIVDFTATWCPPCQSIGPKFVEFASLYTNLKFCKVDVDEAADVAQAYGISAMPTFLVFKDGQKQEDDTLKGADEAALEALCKKYN